MYLTRHARARARKKGLWLWFPRLAKIFGRRADSRQSRIRVLWGVAYVYTLDFKTLKTVYLKGE